jgi:hypothetical protein
VASASIQIDKGIPLPTGGKSGVRRWPFDQMEIGDSFFSTDLALQSAAHSWAALHRKKIITRKVDGGVRVWRVA